MLFKTTSFMAHQMVMAAYEHNGLVRHARNVPARFPGDAFVRKMLKRRIAWLHGFLFSEGLKVIARRLPAFGIIFLLYCMGAAGVLAAAADSQPANQPRLHGGTAPVWDIRGSLTAQEKAWLEQHPVFRLGVDPAYAPFEFVDKGGNYCGMASDYMKLIEARLGVRFSVMPRQPWDQVLAKLQSRELDVSPALQYTPEREQYLEFTQPYLKFLIGIVTRSDHVTVSNLSTLAGKKVALVRTYNFSFQTLKTQPDIVPVYVDSVVDGLNVVTRGDAEAIVCDLASLSYHITEYNFLNLKVAGIAPFETEGLRIGVRKDWAPVIPVLEKAIQSITPEEHQQIRRRWITVRLPETSGIDLSPEERQWLARHPVVRVASSKDWNPIEFIDDKGRMAGISSEYVALLERHLGIHFEPVAGLSWAEMLQALREGRIDMATCICNIPERRAYLDFTESYVSMPAAIFTRTDVNYVDLPALKGRAVAVIEGYAIQSFLKSQYHDIRLVVVRDVGEGLQKLSDGDVYAYIDALAVGTHGITRHRLSSVRVCGETPFRYDLAMASSTNHPQLASILRKVIHSIPEAERERFYQKWATAQYSSRPNYSLIWKVLLLGGGVILVFVYWNRRLSVEVVRRRQVENELRLATAELEKRVADRTAQLKARNDSLAEEVCERLKAEQESIRLQQQLHQAMKMEAIGRLAGGVAHDFNNMLTSIIGNVDIARMDMPAGNPAMACLNEIEKAAESAASLTRQLLAFSRRQIIEPRLVDLNELVVNLQKMLGRLIGENIVMKAVLKEGLGAVKVDPGQFEQVLINLVVNARDAMPSGGHLVISTGHVDLKEERRVHQENMQPGPYVSLAVCDNGQGMSEEVKQHIFEPFFTTKPLGRGTGLGLATIFGTVKQAGGFIDVASEPGKGTTMTIYLPRIDRQADKISLSSPKSHLPKGSETILMVEDQDNVRNMNAAVLKKLGYKVLLASNGHEAVKVAQTSTEPIHLLMTDVVMPGMNGRELASRISRIFPDIKVLLTSGYSDELVFDQGLVDGRSFFLAKPYSLQSLASKLREILDVSPSV